MSGPVFGERPRYYAFGGLVFCPLTVDYLQAWGEGWPVRAPRHLVSLFPRWASVQGEEPVVLCNVLRGDINSGYEENEESLVVKADGHPLRNLAQLVDIIESKPTGLLVLEAQDGKQIVLDQAGLGKEAVTPRRSSSMRTSRRDICDEGLCASRGPYNFGYPQYAECARSYLQMLCYTTGDGKLRRLPSRLHTS